jgi:hypothetical protein
MDQLRICGKIGFPAVLTREKKMDKQFLSSPVESYINEQGLLIPKDWLIGIEKKEIRKKDNVITIIPVEKDDPISELGTKPVSCGITDGSQEHDKYIYG